jgi:precorrin-4/cobalt-precorrin-4 C11-methyltransferase
LPGRVGKKDIHDYQHAGRQAERERNPPMTARVHFVGAGPGDPELLTVKAARVISQADLIVYPGSLTPQAITDLAKPGAALLDSASMTLEETHAAIMAAWRSGGRVARLQAGDPALYGTVAEQARLLSAEGVDYAVVPGITAASATAAALKVSATAPEITQTLILTRLSGRTPVPEAETLRDLARHHSALAVYLSAAEPEAVREELLAGGYPPHTCVAIAYRVGWPEEELHLSTVADFPELTRERGLTRQTLFLVLPGYGAETRSRLYAPEFTHGARIGSASSTD